MAMHVRRRKAIDAMEPFDRSVVVTECLATRPGAAKHLPATTGVWGTVLAAHVCLCREKVTRHFDE